MIYFLLSNDTTIKLQYKDNKNIGFKAGKADKNFTEERFTHLLFANM